MDTSEKYITMCVTAEEMQSYRRVDNPFQVGDWTDKGIVSAEFYPKAIALEMVYVETAAGVKGFNYGEIKILPTKDQLRRLAGQAINVDPSVTEEQFHKFWLASDNKDYKSTRSFNTDEQLWLTFLMARKYGKYWNNLKWTPRN